MISNRYTAQQAFFGFGIVRDITRTSACTYYMHVYICFNSVDGNTFDCTHSFQSYPADRRALILLQHLSNKNIVENTLTDFILLEILLSKKTSIIEKSLYE